MIKKDDLKLIYVLKIGYDTKGQGLYEFIFSKDPSLIDPDAFGWNQIPAKGNANAPSEEYIDKILSLKTNKIDLICLHDLEDRAYIDGYYTKHCLAYEDLDSENSDVMYDETKLIVLHYGTTMTEVKDLFLERDILLKDTDFVKTVTPVVASSDEDEEEEEDEEINF
jgi:hypothetical protein